VNDLIILVPDKNTQFFIEGLLANIFKVEPMEGITFKTITHYQRDPGVYKEAVQLLRPFITQYNFAMVVFDPSRS
jgi:hypothetical protein